MNMRQLASRWPGPRLRWRQALGLVIVGAGTVLALHDGAGALADPRVAAGLAAGLMAAAATALGTLPVLLSQRVSAAAADAMLGFGAGVMLAATAFSLVVPALQAAGQGGHGPWMAGGIVAIGLGLGAGLLLLGERLVPAAPGGPGGDADAASARALRRAWVFVAAIALHNLPEGLAIGVGFGGADHSHARALATGIAVQDVPEGLVVALALRSAGHGRWSAAGWGAASGLLEPLAAVLGVVAVTTMAGLLPWGLAFAAGAMLYAVSHEAIPGAHGNGHARLATLALVLGFALMTVLDTALAAPG